MPRCRVCKAETPASHYDRTVYNLTPLYGPWEAWRMAGRFLVAPGKAGRIIPERLLGMLWEEQARRRVQIRRSTEMNGTMPPRSTAIVLPVSFPDPGKRA